MRRRHQLRSLRRTQRRTPLPRLRGALAALLPTAFVAQKHRGRRLGAPASGTAFHLWLATMAIAVAVIQTAVAVIIAVEAIATRELLLPRPIRVVVEAPRRNVNRFGTVVHRRWSDVSRATNMHAHREMLRFRRRCRDEDCACERCRREDPDCRRLYTCKLRCCV